MISFVNSILYYPKALNFVFKNGLSKYFIYSGFISLVLGSLTFGSVYFFADDLGAWISAFYPFDWGASAISKVSAYLGGAIISIFSFIIYKYALLICVGPFMGPLSEKVQEIKTNIPTTKQGIGQVGYGVIRGIRLALRNVIRELFYSLIVLMLGLLPIFSPFSAVLLLAIQAFYIGFANVDYHLEKTHSVSESVTYNRANRFSSIGNGAGYMMILLIPIIGLLMAPVLGTVAATLKVLDSE